MAGVIGRERELAAVEEFLEDSNAPGILIVQGEPGIGKTTVWSSGVAAAAERGYRVLSARPAQVETTMSFSAVRDLLQPILGEVSPGLPDPQRRALEIALLLAEPGEVPPDPGVISYAFASALRAAATSGRLLVAVDDIQWLDRPSATALTYVLRRLGEYPVGFLLAQRVGEPDQTETDLGQALPEDRVDCVNLGPLTLGAIQRLLGERLGQRLSRPTLHRVYTSSGGNPFYALEIARALERRGRPVAPGEPLPVPDTLAEIVNERLAALPTATERALQAAALISNPTVEVVASVLEEEPALATAVNAHVIEIEGDEIVFSHPLLASGLASRIKSSALRSLHGRIAAAISDPEERARHLALAAEGPDEEAAAVIEVAAGLARSRGAPEVAAELIEEALALTPPDREDVLLPRLLAGAETQRDAGDWARARELAERAIQLQGPGPERARALLALARASAEPAEPAARALAEASDDRKMRAEIGMQLVLGHFLTDFRRAMQDARGAAEDAEAAGDSSLVAQALALLAWFEGACADGDPLETLARSASFEETAAPPSGFTSEFNLATVQMWRDEHDSARAGFSHELRMADDLGDAYRRMHALIHLAQVEWRAGEWAQAEDYSEAALEVWGSSGDDQGISAVLWTDAVIGAHRGELERARANVESALSARVEDRLHDARHAWVLGFAALSEGDVEEALRHLEPAARIFRELGAVEPGMRLYESDLIEARVAGGMLDAAETEAAELLELGERLGRPRARAIGLRGRGLVLAGGGDLVGAVACLRDSAALTDSFPVPFEQARTLLALGAVERRARRRREARASLEQALSLFELLGAPLWADKARSELSRIGGRAKDRDDLTPAERRVAELVAQGKKNREVAAELVVSVHTVESALTQIYRKLGVRSRTELARRFSESD